MADTPTSRRRGQRWLALAFGLLVATVVAEVVLRATHWGVWRPRTDDYHILKRSDRTYWFFDVNHPTTHTWDRDPYGRLPTGAKMTYPLNSHGCRGAEPVEGRPKVLFAGDSFTFGEGVDVGDTFVARVERALASASSPPPQAINAGVPGYGSPHEAERMPDWLEEFKPRAVVLVYVPNDPIPLDQSFDRGEDLLRVGAADPAGLEIVRLISGALKSSDASRATEEWYLSYYFGERREHWDKTKTDLLAMKKAVEKSGAKFGVVYFPLLHRLKDGPFSRIDEAVARRCLEIGAAFLDLTPALAREPEQSLWVHPTDHHPDARAHEIAAEVMTPFVLDLLR